MPWNSITSVPGCRGRYRSAMPAVSVRRGSATMIFSAGLAFLASSMRRNSTGWANAVLLPTMNRHCAWFDVVVAGRRRVGAQRELVAGHRAAHAQARVAVDVVGADQALGQLVEDVVVLGQQLAADVEAHGVGAVRLDDAGEPARWPGPAPRPSATAWGAAPRCARCIGCSSRVWRVTACVAVRCRVEPLVHSRPKLAGWSGSPRTPVIWSPCDSMITPQPTPQ